MSAATIIMVVLICLGAALTLAALGFVGFRAFKLVKAGRAAGIKSRAQVQQVTGRVQRLAPRIRDLETKQKAVAEGIKNLTATANKSD